ncbi:MAG: sigma-70 family RNA polymerase sigma factor [Cetobacterium sp.]|nr:sigma-70 family RNA polymerase sigma factor [Cetobacterium sp.]
MTNEEYLQYEPMIYKIANKYKNNRFKIELDDLIQIGSIGLLKGFSSYDDKKDMKLDTWLFSCISREIFKEFDYFNKQKRSLKKSISINSYTDENQETTIEDIIQDENTNVSKQVISKITVLEYKKEIQRVLYSKELIVVNGSLFEGRTLSDIANELNVTVPRVREIRNRAFRILTQKSKLIRHEYLKLKELEAERELLLAYSDPVKQYNANLTYILDRLSEKKKEFWKNEILILDTIQELIKGIEYFKIDVLSFLVTNCNDILQDEYINKLREIVETKTVSYKESFELVKKIKLILTSKQNKEKVSYRYLEYKNKLNKIA